MPRKRRLIIAIIAASVWSPMWMSAFLRDTFSEEFYSKWLAREHFDFVGLAISGAIQIGLVWWLFNKLWPEKAGRGKDNNG